MLKCALPGPHNTLSIMLSIVVTREGEKPHSATLPINKAATCKTLWENNSKSVLLKEGSCKVNHWDSKENNYFSRCFQDAFAATDIISRHFLKYCWNPALALMKSSLLSLLIGNPINRSLFCKCLTAGISVGSIWVTVKWITWRWRAGLSGRSCCLSAAKIRNTCMSIWYSTPSLKSLCARTGFYKCWGENPSWIHSSEWHQLWYNLPHAGICWDRNFGELDYISRLQYYIFPL